tara:strand:- start:53 stop:808 length:756 start_codon:yes stop_codon:yes gene_type:complete
MTFKLRSGNKPTFKSMGSSPLHQTGTGLVGGAGDNVSEDIKKRTYISKEQQLQKEIDYKELRQAQLEQKLEDAPWSKTRKKENITMRDKDGNIIGETVSPTGEDGYDYDHDVMSDENINKYKSKEQIRQDARDRKLQSKSTDNKYTKDEKYADKMAELGDKYQRARGTGSMGLKFNWKNALLSDGLLGGFSIERKQDIIADKMTKKASKRRDAQLKKERRTARKNYKKYTKNLEKGDDQMSFDEWRTQQEK